MAAYARSYKAGQVLFEEGSPSVSIFIIKKGAVSIRKIKGKHFVEIAKVQANEVIGELSFFDRNPRSATAVAIIDVDALEIPFESMEKIYNGIPDYLKAIMASMAERLRKANEQIRVLQKQLHRNKDEE
ncbi:MAG: Crp/Fnr family transcriptional regulator [Bdellovibrio sp.]|nr:Crp/Fnr family transcriptional regulator [Bdellovibrio sp.]